MAVEKNIKINLDASDAVKDLKKVSSEVDATFADLRRTTPIVLDGTKAKKVLGDVDSKVGDVKRGAQEIGPAAEGSAKGFNVMNISVKAVAASLKAAGIGLVISLFVKLGEALSRNQVFMDKFNIVTESVGMAFQKLINFIVDVGEKITPFIKKAAKLTTQFTFVGKAVKFLSDKLKDNNKDVDSNKKGIGELAAEIVNLRNEVKLAEAQQRLLQLTFQKDAEIQRQIRDDVSLTIEERIAANNKLADILDEQFEAEKLLADRKLELAQKEAAQNEENIDLQVALINAQAELADLEERITGQRSENKVNAVALEKELLEDQKKLGEQEEAIVIKKMGTEELIRKEVKKTFELRKGLAHKEVEIQRLTSEQKRDIIANSLGGVISLMGEESKAGKALAVGQALINTYSAAAAALAPPPTGAGPIFGPIAAVGAVAAGLANVKKIVATKLPGVTDDGGDTGATPAIPQAGFSGFGGLVPNIDAITPPDTGVQPVQAFVVENDISDAQALQEELDIQATL
tara:strand:- start:155 stop:1705 length:1551 start_codon:yes stop_codon:yes gene_type:complete